MRAQAYRVNEPRIVHQTIDGETILIDFENGAYYSTIGSGACIWECLASGLDEDAVFEFLLSRFPGDRSSIENSLRSFIDILIEQALLLPLEPAAGAATATPGARSATARTAPCDGLPGFEVPQLTRYTDMQDLLLLDPVHDVSEQGWPARP